MEKWQAQIDEILSGFVSSPRQTAQDKYRDFLAHLAHRREAEELYDRMRRLEPTAVERFARLVEGIDHPSFTLPDGEEHDAQLFAAMNFVAWYLHQAWRSEHQTLSVSCARSLAFVLMVGIELGRILQEGDS